MKYLHHLATFVSLLILVLIIHNHFSDATNGSILPANANIQTQTHKEANFTKKIQKIDPDSVVAWHIFGVQKTTKKPQQITETALPDFNQLPKSKLDLSLNGLFTHDDQSKGHAIITDKKNRKTGSYQVGDVITKNIKLHAVSHDHVILKKNERLEILNLPEFKTQSRKQANLKKGLRNSNNFAQRNKKS